MKTMRRTLGRRTFLRGAAGASIALPLLGSLRGDAAPGDAPRRLIIMFTPNGPNPNTWCSGSESSYTLGASLQPLAAYESELLLLSEIDHESSHNGVGDQAHQRCMPHMLTGIEMVPTGGGNLSETGGGISVDQHIAGQLGAGTKFDSLQFGVGSVKNQAGPFNTISFSGPAAPVPAEDDPQAMFDRVFAELSGDIDEISALRAKRHSVLDVVMEDARRVRAQLGPRTPCASTATSMPCGTSRPPSTPPARSGARASCPTPAFS